MANYRVIAPHQSEFPQPITFVTGTSLQVGACYDGDEEWEHWFFCEACGQQGGWVPAQVIDMTSPGHGVALEDYTARELDVEIGEHLTGTRQLNGWVWCQRQDDTGWVPLRNLQLDPD